MAMAANQADRWERFADNVKAVVKIARQNPFRDLSQSAFKAAIIDRALNHDSMRPHINFGDPLGASSARPRPIAYTVQEGGEWIKWKQRECRVNIFSIMLDDGSIIDRVAGWRSYDDAGLARVKELIAE